MGGGTPRGFYLVTYFIRWENKFCSVFKVVSTAGWI